MKYIFLIILTTLFSVNSHARHLKVYGQSGNGGGKVHTSVLKQMGVGTFALMSVTTDYFSIGPAAIVGFGCLIGPGSFIGPASIVEDGAHIREGAITGLGSKVKAGAIGKFQDSCHLKVA